MKLSRRWGTRLSWLDQMWAIRLGALAKAGIYAWSLLANQPNRTVISLPSVSLKCYLTCNLLRVQSHKEVEAIDFKA
jgi:hypothetical protein